MWTSPTELTNWIFDVVYTIGGTEYELRIIIHFQLSYPSSGYLWEVKNKRKFQTLSSEVFVAAYER